LGNWLKVAEVMDAFRLIPRLLLLATYSFVLWYTVDFTQFYFKLIELPEISDWKLAAYTAFGGLTIPAIAGLAKGMTTSYLESGRVWKSKGTE
jgi:hypothetical protein